MPSALLFDVGEVLMHDSWTLVGMLAERGALAPERTHLVAELRGPHAPERDDAWRAHLRGELDALAYWDQLAMRLGCSDRLALFRRMADVLADDVFAPDALAFVASARRAGVPTGVLSNDLIRTSSRVWVEAREALAGFDVFLDATEIGERKPAPGPYLKASAAFGLPPGEIVFLDDTPECIDGARAVGMIGVLVDPLRRGEAFAAAATLVGMS